MSPIELYKILLSKFGKQNWWPGDSGEEVIIGAILTQNTTWKNVEKAIVKLRKNNLLDFSSINEIAKDKLAKYIYSTGYYNQKSKRLKRISRFFNQYDNLELRQISTHEFRRKLLDIKGIGPETADSILLYAFNRPIFVVDAYTRRIGKRLGFWNNKITYQQCQSYFMKKLSSDSDLFNEYHALLVKLGKEICKSKPRCKNCFLIEKCKRNIN